jgi:hypothetical protein
MSVSFSTFFSKFIFKNSGGTVDQYELNFECTNCEYRDCDGNVNGAPGDGVKSIARHYWRELFIVHRFIPMRRDECVHVPAVAANESKQ